MDEGIGKYTRIDRSRRSATSDVRSRELVRHRLDGDAGVAPDDHLHPVPTVVLAERFLAPLAEVRWDGGEWDEDVRRRAVGHADEVGWGDADDRIVHDTDLEALADHVRRIELGAPEAMAYDGDGYASGDRVFSCGEVASEDWRRVEELEERRRDADDLPRRRRVAVADSETPLGVGRHRGDGPRRSQEVTVSKKREDGIGVGAFLICRLEIDAVHFRGRAEQ